jgi:hypothetical protein
MIVNRSPSCSTESNTSAKLRAALVALISVTKSDYQIFCVGGLKSQNCDWRLLRGG